jgi:type I restriction enzyme S subunit
MIWKKKTLGDLCHIEKGKIGIQKATPGEFPLVVTAEERLSHNEFHFEGNAVIIPLVSSTGHGHKSLKRIHFQSGKFAVGNILCAVIPKDENVLRADYLFRFLDLNREKELVSRMKGMANVTLPIKEIAKVEIPIPPIEAQIDFVQQYSVLEEKSNDLGEEIEHQLEMVKKLRHAFLREAMQGRLVPQDINDEPASVLLEKIKAEKERLIKEKKIKQQKPLPPITEDEIPFEIPGNWVLTRVGEVCTKVTDGFHHTPKKLKEGKIYISATHIREYGIDWDNCQFIPEKEHDELFKKAYPQKGEILITNRGAGCATPAIIDIDDSFSFQNAALIGFNQSFMSNRFLFYFILKNRDDIMEYFVNGGLQPMLSNVVLSKIPLPLPPLSEQQRIVAKLDELMAYCDELETSIKESQQQNELLLQQVLREALEPKEKEVERV